MVSSQVKPAGGSRNAKKIPGIDPEQVVGRRNRRVVEPQHARRGPRPEIQEHLAAVGRQVAVLVPRDVRGQALARAGREVDRVEVRRLEPGLAARRDDRSPVGRESVRLPPGRVVDDPRGCRGACRAHPMTKSATITSQAVGVGTPQTTCSRRRPVHVVVGRPCVARREPDGSVRRSSRVELLAKPPPALPVANGWSRSEMKMIASPTADATSTPSLFPGCPHVMHATPVPSAFATWIWELSATARGNTILVRPGRTTFRRSRRCSSSRRRRREILVAASGGGKLAVGVSAGEGQRSPLTNWPSRSRGAHSSAPGLKMPTAARPALGLSVPVAVEPPAAAGVASAGWTEQLSASRCERIFRGGRRPGVVSPAGGGGTGRSHRELAASRTTMELRSATTMWASRASRARGPPPVDDRIGLSPMIRGTSAIELHGLRDVSRRTAPRIEQGVGGREIPDVARHRRERAAVSAGAGSR